MLQSDQKISDDFETEAALQVADLADRARAGNREAFAELVDLFHGDVFRMVFYRTRSRMDAEDITQEIFMSAFSSLPELKDAERFRPWLFRIGVNRVRDFYRKQKIRSLFRRLIERDAADTAGRRGENSPDARENLVKREFWRHIDSMLGRLSRAEREVFLLRFMDHLAIRDISQVLRKSESAVKTHLYRAIKKFRKDARLAKFLSEDIP